MPPPQLLVEIVLPGLASNHCVPVLHLLSSWDYRCEPVHLALNIFFKLKVIIGTIDVILLWTAIYCIHINGICDSFFFVALGFEFRASCLLGSHCTT
jgi:hypothetical protein